MVSADKEALVAMKIRNYSAISASFARPVVGELVSEIVRRIHVGSPGIIVYHEADVLAWRQPFRDRVGLSEHLEGLHRIVYQGIVIDGRSIDLSFVCGVDLASESTMANRLGNAIHAAESAMHSDGLVRFHDLTKPDLEWEISLLSSLDQAIAAGHVSVAYQPKLDLASSLIIGAEALVRWNHPERGPIDPEYFIQIAESHGRIEHLTQFVLGEATAAAARLIAAGQRFSVSVNISAQLLESDSLIDMVQTALETSGLEPGSLILEITETGQLDRSGRGVAMMQRLVAAGLQLSIDDFGTGKATIDYLRILPASEVKIDKSFVLSLDDNVTDQLLVSSIVGMAHSLGRRVVAEGVETKESLERLRSIGCDIVQGYYVGRPMSLAGLSALLPQTGRAIARG
jgi:diguanylate cyclase